MPIAFPPYRRYEFMTSMSKLFNKPFFVVPAPNMQAPNKVFSDKIKNFDPNKAQKALVTNYRELGRTYRDVQRTSIVNPINRPENIFSGNRLFERKLGRINMIMSGVSRDAVGATLGNCQVLIFRTEDKTLVAETTSDASGNWSVLIMKGGPFFLVEYKEGTPVFGTSANTLVPVQQ